MSLVEKRKSKSTAWLIVSLIIRTVFWLFGALAIGVGITSSGDQQAILIIVGLVICGVTGIAAAGGIFSAAKQTTKNSAADYMIDERGSVREVNKGATCLIAILTYTFGFIVGTMATPVIGIMDFVILIKRAKDRPSKNAGQNASDFDAAGHRMQPYPQDGQPLNAWEIQKDVIIQFCEKVKRDEPGSAGQLLDEITKSFPIVLALAKSSAATEYWSEIGASLTYVHEELTNIFDAGQSASQSSINDLYQTLSDFSDYLKVASPPAAALNASSVVQPQAGAPSAAQQGASKAPSRKTGKGLSVASFITALLSPVIYFAAWYVLRMLTGNDTIAQIATVAAPFCGLVFAIAALVRRKRSKSKSKATVSFAVIGLILCLALISVYAFYIIQETLQSI